MKRVIEEAHLYIILKHEERYVYICRNNFYKSPYMLLVSMEKVFHGEAIICLFFAMIDSFLFVASQNRGANSNRALVAQQFCIDVSVVFFRKMLQNGCRRHNDVDTSELE
jgi:hypothetical protein